MTDTSGPWSRSPVVAKRWLGLQMRRRREAAGVTPRAAAEALRSVVAKVGYTEAGTHAFKPRDLTEVLFPLYGVPEGEQPALLAACRHGRDRGWWQAYDCEALPDWARRYVGLEQGATTLRSWVTLHPHPLVRTRAYAEALLRNEYAPRLDDDEVDARLELGLERQAVLVRDPHPLRAHFVLDESVLHRLVGGPEVMADQLDHLAVAAERRTVTVQVVPFAHGAHPEAAGDFTLVDFGAPDDPGVVYVEGRVSGEYVEGPAEVEDHATLFDQLGRMALSPQDTLTLVRRLAKEHRG